MAESQKFLRQFTEVELRSKPLTSSTENTGDSSITRQKYVQTDTVELTDFLYKEVREVGIQTEEHFSTCSKCTGVKSEPAISPDVDIFEGNVSEFNTLKKDVNETISIDMNEPIEKLVETPIEMLNNKDDEDKENLPDGQLKTANDSSLNETKTSILNIVKPKNVKSIKREEVTVKGNAEDVIKCLRIAEKAIAEGNLVKAERMLLKSERIHPTDVAKALLKQINAVKAEKQCQKSAETTQKDHIKSNAEENVIGSVNEKIEPTAKDDTKKKSSETAPKKATYLHDKKDQFKDTSSPINKNKKQVNSLEVDDENILASAFIAMAEGEYDFAETLLTEACLQKTSVLAKVYLDILAKTKNIDGKNILAKTSKYVVENLGKEQPMFELKALSEKHYNIANYMLARGIFALAEYILMLAETFHTSERSQKLLKELQVYLESYKEPTKSHKFKSFLNVAYNHLTGKIETDTIQFQTYQVLITEEAAKYVELAKAAVAKYDLSKAELYLDKSMYFSASEVADEMMQRLKSIQISASTANILPVSCLIVYVYGNMENKQQNCSTFILNEHEWPALTSKRRRRKNK